MPKGNTLTLGQVKTGEKSNEITAILQLLELLELSGCIVTIDAMGCRKEIAQGILDRQADYLLAVKENQGRLYQDIRDADFAEFYCADNGRDSVPPSLLATALLLQTHDASPVMVAKFGFRK